MNKKTLVLLAMMAAGMMGGCDWDNPFYNEYVTEDGRVNFCNPKITKETDGTLKVELNTLYCLNDEIKLKDNDKNKEKYGDKFGTKLEACVDKKKCKGEEGCKFCNDYIADYNICVEFRDKEVFEFKKPLPWKPQISFINSLDSNNIINNYPDAVTKGICPKEYPLCSFYSNNMNEGKFGCVENKLICENSNDDNLVKCGDDCVNISNDKNNCGKCGRKCEDILTSINENFEGVDDYLCVNSTCIVSCKLGYHVTYDQTVCEKDDKTRCGSYDYDCTKEKGWENGNCVNGKCESSSCLNGYYVFNGDVNNVRIPCELNSTQSCGVYQKACPINNGIEFPFCAILEEGKQSECGAATCIQGYHITKNRKQCEKDSIYECGSYNNDCTKRTGLGDNNFDKKVKCEHVGDGIGCVIKSCDSGFYLDTDANECKLNTNEHCGGLSKHCENNEVCDNGSCVTKCTNNGVVCGGNCTSLTEPHTCGNCENNCFDYHPNAVSILCLGSSADCNGKSCCRVTDCINGYHVENNECVVDSVTSCFNENCTKLFSSTKNHAIAKCSSNGCDFDCDVDYADCDNNPNNGCEVHLSEFGLKSCTECQDSYTSCGTFVYEPNRLPLCLIQGGSYKNYEFNNYSSDLDFDNYYKDNNNQFSNSKYVVFDYKRYDKSVNYYLKHQYKEEQQTWKSNLFEWNPTNCEIACNRWGNFNGHTVGPNYRDFGETWGHSCQPKQTCHQLDSFEYKSSKPSSGPKFYFDYGCQ